jgi:hypothetical protein
MAIAEPKTTFMTQIGVCWIFFIQFYSSGSHTVPCSCSYHVIE